MKKYTYYKHMGFYKLYVDNGDGTESKIAQSKDKEEIRKKCYELNGWKYTAPNR